MNIYLVGGAVRDELLGLPIKEKDWVVVGETPETMLALGYIPVGKDFPVFLHPETKDEYALARTEKKVSPGYTGFIFNTSPDITLEEDLSRRDLTINAMAKDNHGNIIDPFNGRSDLKDKVLRHISDAFAEDPVRILRLARFAARFPDFRVATETNVLMKAIVEKGEADALVSERIWQEFNKALASKKPIRFFEVLIQCGALKHIFPHLNFDEHAANALIKATATDVDPSIRFAALLHNNSDINELCKAIKSPRDYKELANLISHFHKEFEHLNLDHSENLVSFFEKLDVFRRPERFQKFLIAASACSRHSMKNKVININHALKILHTISIKDIDPNLKGKAIANAIHNERVTRLKEKFYHG